MEEPNRIRNHNEETTSKPSALEMQPLSSNITKNAIEMEEDNRSQIAGPVPKQEDRVDFKKERGTNHKLLNDEERDTSKRATDWRMDYEVFQWIFIIVFTLIAVIDRYTTNYWPLWVDSPGPTIPGNVGVTIFSIVSWVSSRMLLVSSSYIFLFQNHVFWNWFIENKLVHKCIRIRDIRQSNTRLHYHVGWLFIGVPVMLHVWTIVLAGAFPQNSMKLYNSWMRPNKPDGSGNSIPFYADNLLSLGINDVYRLVSTTVTFAFLIPYSVIKVSRNLNWSFAQWVHLIGALIYTVDLLRMYSHPHSWVFNAPFVLWWICDRVYGIFWYRRSVAVMVKKTQLDEEYIVCYLRVPDKVHSLRSVGDVCWFNLLGGAGWDRAHPFTCFVNHGLTHGNGQKLFGSKKELQRDWKGHKFSIYDPKKIRLLEDPHPNGTDEDEDEDKSELIMDRLTTDATDWMENKRKTERSLSADYIEMIPTENVSDIEELRQEIVMDVAMDGDENGADQRVEVQEVDQECDWNLGIIMQIIPDHTRLCDRRQTWTSKMQSIQEKHCAGLRTWGPYRSEYRILEQVPGEKYPSTPLVLIGTGAGCSFLLDFYFYVIGNDIALQKKVVIYFSTRSIGMFQWFTDITCRRDHKNLYIDAHLTSNNVKYQQKEGKSRESNIGRMNMEAVLDGATNDTQIFYCGSPSIQNMVSKLCEARNLEYHAGHSFN